MIVFDIVLTVFGLGLLAVAITALVVSFFVPPGTRRAKQQPLLDDEMNDRLVAEYPGKWVAVAEHKVLASADSLKALLAQVAEDEAQLVLKVPATAEVTA